MADSSRNYDGDDNPTVGIKLGFCSYVSHDFATESRSIGSSNRFGGDDRKLSLVGGDSE